MKAGIKHRSQREQRKGWANGVPSHWRHSILGRSGMAGEELLSVSMTVATADEIKLLFLEFQSAGVALHQTLKKQPWGAKNFVVKDPDGNLLLFAGPAN